jgi:ABC-type phosphate/phosphonate transport system substrate-binding protein
MSPPMIVSLPMYDWPQVRAATDALWQGIARHLAANGFAGVPAGLDRSGDLHVQWRSPDLLLSQTCGYPLTHALKGAVDLVATPCYGVRGCAGADYCSLIVVARTSKATRLADLRGKIAAYNTPDSMSGLLALKAVVAPLARGGRFFGEVLHAGAHVASMQAVAAGAADVAAIDCVSFALAERHRPELAGKLRVIAETPRVPGLPLITARGRPGPERVRLARALAEAFADPALAGVRAELFIGGLEFPPLSAYLRILELEAAADATGYTSLA